MNSLKNKVKQKAYFRFPHFVYLLPIFFVFHGFTENYTLISIADSFFLTMWYLGVAGIILSISWLLLRSFAKAALFTFLILSFHFFFGSWHDWSKKILGDIFVTRYSFILPLTLVLFVGAFLYLKKRNREFIKLSGYLNLALLVLILIDGATLINKTNNPKRPIANIFTHIPDTCSKPDIYLIIADEYAGEQELKTVFNFDNCAFYNELSNREFHVIKNSRSNYNITPFSMASTLNMGFLPIKQQEHTAEHVSHIMEMIKFNSLINLLESGGYKIFNNSVFDLGKEPTKTQKTFLPLGTVYITSQTFASRLERDLSYHLVTNLKLEWASKEVIYTNHKNNLLLYKTTLETVTSKKSPKFSYTHLIMPHYPYYFDKNGKFYDYSLLTDPDAKGRYLMYLQYSNKKYIELIDHILTRSATPPIIIFMSDHGFKFKSDSPYKDLSFSNLISVYLPSKNYKAFYDGMTNVNVFRTVLNENFKQNLPLLKDSTTYLQE